MAERSVAHDSFTIERTYDAAPDRVFRAWSDADAKAQWFHGPRQWTARERRLDFRVGGRERVVGQAPGFPASTFDAHYLDIVPDRRILYCYEMHLDDRKISVSLATVTFEPAGSGTRLIVTEQGTFLDGYDDAGSREEGTRGLLDQLARTLA